MYYNIAGTVCQLICEYYQSLLPPLSLELLELLSDQLELDELLELSSQLLDLDGVSSQLELFVGAGASSQLLSIREAGGV